MAGRTADDGSGERWKEEAGSGSAAATAPTSEEGTDGCGMLLIGGAGDGLLLAFGTAAGACTTVLNDATLSGVVCGVDTVYLTVERTRAARLATDTWSAATRFAVTLLRRARRCRWCGSGCSGSLCWPPSQRLLLALQCKHDCWVERRTLLH